MKLAGRTVIGTRRANLILKCAQVVSLPGVSDLHRPLLGFLVPADHAVAARARPFLRPEEYGMPAPPQSNALFYSDWFAVCGKAKAI